MGRPLQGEVVSLSLLTITSCVHGLKQTLQSELGGSAGWAGSVTPAYPNCGNQTTGLMTLSSKEFSFDPFGSITVIQGKVDHNHLEGSVTRAAPGQKGITFQFVGTVNHPAKGPPTILGTMTSGQCTWSVTLHRG
jgi:hypothetical protein